MTALTAHLVVSALNVSVKRRPSKTRNMSGIDKLTRTSGFVRFDMLDNVVGFAF